MLDVSQIKTELEEERVRVVKQLAELGDDVAGSDEIGAEEGFADSGAVSAERREVYTLIGTMRDSLGEIDAALARIADGSYGTCERCGNPIGDARLEALPSARWCLDCAAVVER
ncbi:MAG: TraR/DksA C4-type zinc finger protein [Acidimicrobiia bacterium]|nr:TraR/DksA C4-type zinc finger protein [Acidimicrobiia bacterium]